ncbi:Uma2 family endonuclease [Yinghuangia aomiensis]|uniref:Uma2 family endonuclease n=1 Tax=Yinghuangia aomiensis TaxID=676205 RepID=A0ABP9HZY0_9ACTN
MTLALERAAAVTDEHRTDDMEAFFDSFDPPEGYRAELIGGAIVMSPTSVGLHHVLLHRLTKEFLEAHLPQGALSTAFPLTVWIPEGVDGDAEGYIPDLVVADEGAMLEPGRWKFDPDAVHLAVEVVSKGSQSQRDDRIHKPIGYAAAGVPLYLLIDPLRREVTLFAKPEDKAYLRKTSVAFGDKIPFPEPFDGVLDTSIFIT